MNWTKIANDALKAASKGGAGKRTGSHTRRVKKPWWWGIVALLIAGGSYVVKQYSRQTTAPPSARSTATAGKQSSSITDDSLRVAIAQKKSDAPVDGSGQVVRTLPDDTQGDRHQRFILRLADGTTVMVAHNIDLAKRAPVKAGEQVTFRGEYVWNEQGGVVHWTHHDPAGRHRGGWLEVGGEKYE